VIGDWLMMATSDGELHCQQWAFSGRGGFSQPGKESGAEQSADIRAGCCVVKSIGYLL